jgi:ribosomal protein S18 acetylase RimI-like enzyme
MQFALLGCLMSYSTFILAGGKETLSYFSNMAVIAEYRRQGVGRRLLAAAEEEASAQGARAAYLHVAKDNYAAMGLYSE